MNSPMITPDASFSEQSRKSLQNDLAGLGSLNNHATPEAKAKKLREACEGFESIFIQKMWQEMRNTVPKGGMMHGKEERFWQDMYDQELSKSMTTAGGIGLADMMYEQLSSSLANATKTTVGQGSMSAFTPLAAPLMPEPEAQPIIEEEAPKAQPVASIYEGSAPDTGAAPVEEEAPAPMPVTPPVTPQAANREITEEVKKEPKRHPGKIKRAGTDGDSGINLAYLARREAGDKLGNHAVRPPLHAQKHKEEASEPVREAAPAPNPGSAADLRAAVENARSGAAQPVDNGGRTIQDIVTQVKLRNAQTQAQADGAVEAAEASPNVRRVRVTSNVQKQRKTSKQARDAIRMLNVDNAASKASKGAAAYQMAQEAAKPQATQVAEAPVAPEAIKPLTAQESAQESNFTIPPLTGNGING